MVSPKDSDILRENLGGSVVSNVFINGGHLTFQLAKDTSFITEEILPLIKAYNSLDK